MVAAVAHAALALRNTLLDDLRSLAGAHPDDAIVREWLATGLYNTLSEAEIPDELALRNALLDELRTLATTYPDDITVRGRLDGYPATSCVGINPKNLNRPPKR
jgi:hypothetical protein